MTKKVLFIVFLTLLTIGGAYFATVTWWSPTGDHDAEPAEASVRGARLVVEPGTTLPLTTLFDIPQSILSRIETIEVRRAAGRGGQIIQDNAPVAQNRKAVSLSREDLPTVSVHMGDGHTQIFALRYAAGNSWSKWHSGALINKVIRDETERVDRINAEILEILRDGEDRDHLVQALHAKCQAWMPQYVSFLEAASEGGYAMVPLEAFEDSGTDGNLLYMRHDIHVRDIAGGACMMVLEGRRGVSSSMHLHWNAAARQDAARDDFLLLKKLEGFGHRWGLHLSPADSYLWFKHCPDYTQQNDRCLRPFVDRLVGSRDFKEAARSEYWYEPFPGYRVLKDADRFAPGLVRDLVTGGRNRFADALASLREAFSPVSSWSSHGGMTLQKQALRMRREKDTPTQQIGEFVGMIGQGHTFLGLEWATKHGAGIEPYQMMSRYGLDYLTDSITTRVSGACFEARLREIMARGEPFHVLVHPYLWLYGLPGQDPSEPCERIGATY